MVKITHCESARGSLVSLDCCDQTTLPRRRLTCADRVARKAPLKPLPSCLLSIGNADHDKAMPAAAFSMPDNHLFPEPSNEDEMYQATASAAERAEQRGAMYKWSSDERLLEVA
jgi:hypothetical protein